MNAAEIDPTPMTPTIQSDPGPGAPVPSGEVLIAELAQFLAARTHRPADLIRAELIGICNGSNLSYRQLVSVLESHRRWSADRCLFLLWQKWKLESQTRTWTVESAAEWLAALTGRAHGVMVQQLRARMPEGATVNSALLTLIDLYVSRMVTEVRSHPTRLTEPDAV